MVTAVRHLAIIMDGNRRWAKNQGLDERKGHEHGAKCAQEAISFCLKRGITHLSLYTFSLENGTSRPLHERIFLYSLLEQTCAKIMEAPELAQVAIRFIGDRTTYPEKLLPHIERVENRQLSTIALTVHIMFHYGARQEILAAIKALDAAHINPKTVTHEQLKTQLWTGNIPDPDLIIRTGKQQRLSNFLLYQAAYSELIFLPVYWPEITEIDLANALHTFDLRQRNFGA